MSDTARDKTEQPAPSRYGLNDSIKSFVEDVLDLTVPKGKDRWRERIERRWSEEQEKFADKTDSTRKLYGSKFRKALKESIAAADVPDRRKAFLEEELLKLVRIDSDTIARLNETYRKRVHTTNVNLVLVDKWQEIVAEFTLLLQHPNPRIKALAILALTGRRFVEVLQLGDFEPVYESGAGGRIVHKYLLSFSGQTKTRGAEGSKFGRSYTIPTLAPAADVLRAFHEMRSSAVGQEWLSVTQEHLNATFNSSLNRTLRERSEIVSRWPEDHPLTIKMLRPFYAEVAYEAFAPRMTKATYFATILGHSEDDYQTALSYMLFSLNQRGLRSGMEEVNRLVIQLDQQQEAFTGEAQARREEDDDEEVIDQDG